MTLAEKWNRDLKTRQISFPTSVRLRPEVDSMLQQVLAEFPHLTQTHILNDLLHDGLNQVISTISKL